MKYIREIRMGPPKTYKTGAVVASYPKPMLVLEGDEGGLDVVKDPIKWLTADELKLACNPAYKQEPITAVQFGENPDLKLTEAFGAVGNQKPFTAFNEMCNNLFLVGCPFRTVVVDPVTIISNLILSAFAGKNPSKMEDARKWAGAVGQKTASTMATFFTLKCHVVFIMHTNEVKITNQLTGEVISTVQEPVIYSKVRSFIGSLPSQFFYQDMKTVGGQTKPYILTVPDARVKGIGCRWPSGLPMEVSPPLFDNIYGEAVKKREMSK